MAKDKRLVITDLPNHLNDLFITTAEAMELTRGQLLTLLMIGNPDVDDVANSKEWRDCMLSRLFELSQL